MEGRTRTWDWLAPLTGAVAIALLVAGFAIGGEPPEASDDQQEILDFYLDNKDSIQIGAVLGGLAGVFLIFFAYHLRTALNAAGQTALSATVLVGAAIIAVAGAIDGTILFALAETADDIDASQLQTLQALWDNDFLLFDLGFLVFLISSGIAIMRTGLLPSWLGWVAIALAILLVTPAFFVGLFGMLAWVLIVSIALAVRARRAAAPATPA